MSNRLYDVGVWFHTNRGGMAKSHGKECELDNPPSLLDGMVEEIEWVPEVGVRRLRRKFEGWRDMERDEDIASAAWVRMKLPKV